MSVTPAPSGRRIVLPAVCPQPLPRADNRHPLLVPLLPTEDEDGLHAVLLRLRCVAAAPQASAEELAALVEAACSALAGVDQEVALSAAARPRNGDRDALQGLVADKHLACGEPTGDETLAPTTLVPLLRRASRLACTDELGERLLDAVGTLTASLAGHGEHSYCIGLGGHGAPLLLRHVPSDRCTGFWPAARLSIGACAAGWAGLCVAGRVVLELGCGTGAVGLACAALGASEVWCTDVDAAALALTARNAAANGAAAVRVARLDCSDEAEEEARPEAMPRRFGLVVAADVVIEGGGSAQGRDGASAAALRAAARSVDAADPQARVLCCFRQTPPSVEPFEAAVRKGESVLDSGLVLEASVHVPADAQGEELLMLLLAPQAQLGRATEADRVPHEVDASALAGWVTAAADSLVENGTVVLRGAQLIPSELLDCCRRDARPRLDRLLRLAADAGAGGGVAPCFRELYCRAPWESRFDVTLRALPAAVLPSEAAFAEPWNALLAAIDPLVKPVLVASGLFGGEDELYVEAMGFVLSEPGAPGQQWHPDAERAGLVNAFVPLVPLSDANGPTALALASHRPPQPCCPRVVRPLLAAGEVLIFDWRTWHRGCANRSPADRPVAYVTYARRGVEGASTYKGTLPSLEAGECDEGSHHAGTDSDGSPSTLEEASTHRACASAAEPPSVDARFSIEHALHIRSRLRTADALEAALTLQQISVELQEMTFDECKATGLSCSSFTSFLTHEDDAVAEAAAELVNVLAGRGAHPRAVRLGPASTELRILEQPGEGSLALRLWRSAYTLSEHVLRRRFADVHGRRVLELGCGLGLPGLACAAAGASSVCLTDLSAESVELARRNATRNGFEAQVSAHTLDWGAPDESPVGALPPFEVVIAADVCYEMEHSESLARVLARMLERGPASRAIVVLDTDTRRLPSFRKSVLHFIETVEALAELRCVHKELDEHDRGCVHTLVYAHADPG